MSSRFDVDMFVQYCCFDPDHALSAFIGVIDAHAPQPTADSRQHADLQ